MDISQVWPEWREDCVLGEGSFGKVYRAKRVEYGRTFYSAIKVLHVPKSYQEVKAARAQGMNDGEIYSYFQSIVDSLLNEITLMDNLKGAQNIVGIEDYRIVEKQGEIGWEIFIRMELLTPFDSFVSNPNFSQLDVIRLGLDICTALEACERNHIIHRDIKPDNIFISRFGEYKLGDFGIARKLETTQANLSRKGTLNFMAPEVYKSEEYGSSVDIYSLGLVLYTLLNNNRMAFLPSYPQQITFKDNETALARRLSGEQLVPPCNATPSLGATIVKACAYNQSQRFRNATEFKNALINEWNAIVQSGNNGALKMETISSNTNSDIFKQRTTNDMTANGTVLIDDLSQDTTVLEGQNYMVGNLNQQDVYNQSFNGNSSEIINYDVSSSYIANKGKSSKICKILSVPFAIAIIVVGLIYAQKSYMPIQLASAYTMFTFAIAMLFSNNKFATGISAIGLSAGYVACPIFYILHPYEVDIADNIVLTVSCLVMFFGGLVMMLQKEIRFAGSLFVYAIVIEWLFCGYQILNGSDPFYIFNPEGVLVFDFGIICRTVVGIGAFIWAYGYNSQYNPTGIKRIISIISIVLSVVATIAVPIVWFSY